MLSQLMANMISNALGDEGAVQQSLSLLHDFSSEDNDESQKEDDDDTDADSEEEEDGKEDKGCSEKCCFWISQCRENWRSLLVILCLWLAYFLCNIASSMMAPFFPQIVSMIGNFAISCRVAYFIDTTPMPLQVIYPLRK